MDSETRFNVERAREGDRQAFEALIRRYSRLVYAQAWGMVSHRQDAEDVVQSAFMKAWSRIGTLDAPEAFVGWLLRIAGNTARDAGRRRRPSPLPEEEAESTDAGGDDPAEHCLNRDVRREVRQAIRALPEKHRAAVTLRYMEGMRYDAIAREMGITNGSLRGLLGRTLTVLRRRLGHLAPETQPRR